MIPPEWTAHLRPGDDELVGYLVPAGGGDPPGQVVPVTVFGYPVGEVSDAESAQRVLEGFGLSYLAETWLLSIDGREDPISVRIVEASPQRLVVQNADYGYEGDIGKVFVLDVPEPGMLEPARTLR